MSGPDPIDDWLDGRDEDGERLGAHLRADPRRARELVLTAGLIDSLRHIDRTVLALPSARRGWLVVVAPLAVAAALAGVMMLRPDPEVGVESGLRLERGSGVVLINGAQVPPTMVVPPGAVVSLGLGAEAWLIDGAARLHLSGPALLRTASGSGGTTLLDAGRLEIATGASEVRVATAELTVTARNAACALTASFTGTTLVVTSGEVVVSEGGRTFVVTAGATHASEPEVGNVVATSRTRGREVLIDDCTTQAWSIDEGPDNIPPNLTIITAGVESFLRMEFIPARTWTGRFAPYAQIGRPIEVPGDAVALRLRLRVERCLPEAHWNCILANADRSRVFLISSQPAVIRLGSGWTEVDLPFPTVPQLLHGKGPFVPGEMRRLVITTLYADVALDIDDLRIVRSAP